MTEAGDFDGHSCHKVFVAAVSQPGLYTQPVPTEKIPGYWVFFGYWVYLFRTYLVNFCMGKYLIPKYPVVPTFWVLCRIEILRDFETYGDSFGLL